MMGKRSGSGSWIGGRRQLLDVGELQRARQEARAAAAAESMEYEEESVFVPNSSPASNGTRNQSSINMAPAAASPASAGTPSPSPSSPTAAGLASLLGSYEDESDDEMGQQTTQLSTSTQQAKSNDDGAAGRPTAGVASTKNSGASTADGWVSCIDEASGDTYWWNQNTDETSWDPPHTVSRTQTKPTQQQLEPATDSVMHAEDANKEVDHAASSAAHAAAASSSDALAIPAQHIESTAPASAIVSSHSSSRSRSPSPSPSPPPPLETAGGKLVLPPGWEEVVDPASGDTYFWNKETDETSWTRPTIAAAAAATKSTVPTQTQAPATDAGAKGAETTSVPDIASAKRTAADSESTVAIDLTENDEQMTAQSPQEQKAEVVIEPVEAKASSEAPRRFSLSIPSSALINALMAGLHARISSHLDRSCAPRFTSSSLQDRLSPLMQFYVELNVLQRQWKEWNEAVQKKAVTKQTNKTDDNAAELCIGDSVYVSTLLNRLQQLTVELDDILKAEREWTNTKSTATPASSPLPPATIAISPSTSASLSESGADMTTAFKSVELAPVPNVKAHVHPSRIGIVAPIVAASAGAQPSPTPSATSTSTSPIQPAAPVTATTATAAGAKRKREVHNTQPPPPTAFIVSAPATHKPPSVSSTPTLTPQTSTQASEAKGVVKRQKKSAAPPITQGRMGELVSKWKAVAAASEAEEHAAQRELDEMEEWLIQRRERGESGPTVVSSANRIPVTTDWRQRVAAVKQVMQQPTLSERDMRPDL